jgi:hypothetical protein
MNISQGICIETRERVWVDDPELSREFMKEVKTTAAGKRYFTDFASPENNERVIAAVWQLHPDAEYITVFAFVDAIATLLAAGELTPTHTPEPAQVVEPPAPLRADGQPMSKSQQRWSEYRQFSESHSMKDCRERARIDVGYRSFMSKNIEREFESVGDSVVPQNPHLVPAEDPTQAALKGIAAKAGLLVPQLLDWVKVYNSTPSSQVRSLRSAASNPLGYEQYEKSLQAAVTAGLI